MTAENQLNLFGLDLSVGARRLQLGLRQLLWGDEAGIRHRFCPPLSLTHVEDLSESTVLEMAERGWAQLVIPESKILHAAITLPAGAEIYLDEAVESHVLASSPFSPEQTCWGYRIRERSASGDMKLDIVILSREAAQETCSLIQDKPECRDVAMSLWAEVLGSPIEIVQMGDMRLRREYFANLRDFIRRLLLGALGLIFLCCVPVFWVAQQADHYSTMRREVELRAAEVTRVRQTLVETRNKLESGYSLLSVQPPYLRWLHKLAEITPDTVYLSRLALDGRQVTISGFADNAADYQSSLSSTGLFANISAPSAFTLDSRAGRERFSLTMTINGAEEQ